jgi:hypothetical protein
MSSSQWNREASELIRLLVLRGYTANQASNFARSSYAKLVTTQEQRLKMNQAVQSAKNAVKRAGGVVRNAGVRAGTTVVGAGIAAGKGAYFGVRAPNRGVRRGFFGAMQRVRQGQANRVRVQPPGKFEKNIKAIENRARTKKNQLKSSLNAQFSVYEKRVNAEKTKEIEKLKQQYSRSIASRNDLKTKASFWGTKKTGVKFGKFW